MSIEPYIRYIYICVIYMVSVIPGLFSSHLPRAILEPGGDQLLGEQQTSAPWCLGEHRLTVDGWLG